MKFIKLNAVRGTNHNHGTKYTVTDLVRSNGANNVEAGTDRMPRRDSKFWGSRYMIWDEEKNCQVRS